MLILIGHGSFDGVEYKFNLPGPDISAAELAALCDRVPAKRQLIVNTTSASGGSIAAFEQARPRRDCRHEERHREERHGVRALLGGGAAAIPTADVDKNDAISALEAFEYADRKTAAFYDSQKRLATEHAVFEDTGKHESGARRFHRNRRRAVALEFHAGAPRRRAEGLRRSGQARPARQERRAGADRSTR